MKINCSITGQYLDCKECKAPDIVGRPCPIWQRDDQAENIASFTRLYCEKVKRDFKDRIIKK